MTTEVDPRLTVTGVEPEPVLASGLGHRLHVTLRAVEEVDPAVLRIECSGGISRAMGQCRLRAGDATAQAAARGVVMPEGRRAVFVFPAPTLPAGSEVMLRITSAAPLTLERVDVGD